MKPQGEPIISLSYSDSEWDELYRFEERVPMPKGLRRAIKTPIRDIRERGGIVFSDTLYGLLRMYLYLMPRIDWLRREFPATGRLFDTMFTRQSGRVSGVEYQNNCIRAVTFDSEFGSFRITLEGDSYAKNEYVMDEGVIIVFLGEEKTPENLLVVEGSRRGTIISHFFRCMK